MILGIDLGTTFSSAACVNCEGIPRIIVNSEGENATPSVVLFEGNNEVVVGSSAKATSIIRSRDIVMDVKNMMGKKTVIKEVNEKKYSPEMISSLILRKVIQDAENYTGEKVDGVVVSVPAYFNDSRRKATADAVQIAGASLMGMINEPTAAALFYAYNSDIKNQNVLVYDLGGGTFDVTIVHIEDMNRINVLCTDGLSATGGRFFDQCIIDYVVESLEQKYGIDLEDEEYLDDLQELAIEAEKIKKQLSSCTKANVVIKIGSIKESIEITRELFEDMISPMYKRTQVKTEAAIKASGLEMQQIDRVLLVGGSGRIPYIRKKLSEFIGKEVLVTVNPDEAVALGAALFAQIGSTGEHFIDVCSHSIGVVVCENAGYENDIIIRKNTRIPVEVERRYRTVADNQECIYLTLTEGEYREITDVNIIGEYKINLPVGVREKELVLIKIRFDMNQLLHIIVKLPESNFEEEYHMVRKTNIPEWEIENVAGLLRDVVVS